MYYKNYRGLFLFAIVALATGCDNNKVDAVAVVAPAATAVGASPMGAFSKQQICKATISTVMGKNPSIMKSDRTENDITYISYIRPDDGSNWAYRCKFDGLTVVWASDTGRWRTDQADSKITFSTNGSTLTISEKYADGSATENSFTSQGLGN